MNSRQVRRTIYTKQVGMTLSEITYADPANMPRQLAYKHHAGVSV